MKKLLVSALALLAISSMAMGANATFEWGASTLDIGAAASVPADVTVTVPLYAKGNGTLLGSFGGGMALYLQAAGPLAITDIAYAEPGMLWAPNNSGDAPVLHDGQLDLNLITMLSTAINMPGSAVTLGNVSVVIPAGTAKGDYWIRTWQENPGITSMSEFSNTDGAFDMTQASGMISVVPEPATALLLLGTLPLLRRRHA